MNQVSEAIRQDVISSFDCVKPLNARPCFPRQGEMARYRERAVAMHNYQEDCNFEGFRQTLGGIVTPPTQDQLVVSKEERAYIHRVNSLVHLNKMTHRDHSVGPPRSDIEITNKAGSRSEDEVDAALALAICLNQNDDFGAGA